MEELRSVALACALFGGVHDLLTKKIPNWFTFPAMVLGVLTNFYFFGTHGAGDSLLGVAVPFLAFLPLFFFSHMGAGDVKLFMAIGAFGGLVFSWNVLLASIIAGGIYAVVDTIYHRRILAVVKSIWRFLKMLITPEYAVESLKLDKRKFPFGIFITIGTGAVFILQMKGRL
jgi:prepilin peptidase CpaA